MAHPNNENVNPNLMHLIQQFMEHHNPYAQLYYTMGYVENLEKRRAENEGVMQHNVRIVLNEVPDRQNYNAP